MLFYVGYVLVRQTAIIVKTGPQTLIVSMQRQKLDFMAEEIINSLAKKMGFERVKIWDRKKNRNPWT